MRSFVSGTAASVPDGQSCLGSFPVRTAGTNQARCNASPTARHRVIVPSADHRPDPDDVIALAPEPPDTHSRYVRYDRPITNAASRWFSFSLPANKRQPTSSIPRYPSHRLQPVPHPPPPSYREVGVHCGEGERWPHSTAQTHAGTPWLGRGWAGWTPATTRTHHDRHSMILSSGDQIAGTRSSTRLGKTA